MAPSFSPPAPPPLDRRARASAIRAWAFAIVIPWDNNYLIARALSLFPLFYFPCSSQSEIDLADLRKPCWRPHKRAAWAS